MLVAARMFCDKLWVPYNDAKPKASHKEQVIEASRKYSSLSVISRVCVTLHRSVVANTSSNRHCRTTAGVMDFLSSLPFSVKNNVPYEFGPDAPKVRAALCCKHPCMAMRSSSSLAKWSLSTPAF